MKNKPAGLFFFIILFVFSETVTADGKLYESYLNSGWAARKENNFKKAEMYYLVAKRLNPESPDVLVGLFYTYIEGENFKKAEVMADKLLTKYPKNLLVRKGAALTYYNRKRFEDAVSQYRYVLKKEGTDPDMQLGLGLSLYHAGRKVAAHNICFKCRDHFSKNDERVRMCLGYRDSKLRVTPLLFISGTDYSDSLTKKWGLTLTAGVDMLLESGTGMYLQGSDLLYEMKETDKTYQQYTTNIALYHSTPSGFLWGCWTRLDGTYEYDTPSNIYTAYLSLKTGTFHFGTEVSKGNYDGFETTQYRPELGLYLGEDYLFKVSGMVQQSSGVIFSSLTEMKSRYSTAVDFKASGEFLTTKLSGYYGERWFTVEDRGLNIWNSDEEFEWGGKINLRFNTDRNRAYYITLRIDKVCKQFGLENDFYVTGITTGISINF